MIRLAVLLCSAALLARAGVGVRILLGVGDTESKDWSGEVSAESARIASVEPWRLDGDDSLQPGNRWKMSTHNIRLFGAQLAVPHPVVANGVLVLLDGEAENTTITVRTAQGNFTTKLSEIPFGVRKAELGARALVERVPQWTRITNDREEQDYPAAVAGKNGEVWLAYAEFKHHPDHNRIRVTPNQFDLLTAKPGGDQILVKRFANGVWGESIAVTAPGGDLYRPAIAVDGQGRPWVFWSANTNGNFDVWARVLDNGKPGVTVRISNAPGSDIDVAAATDSAGQVWVAWQGWRNGKAGIFAASQAASQHGNGFSAPVTVSTSTGNEWNPAIAADASGRVSVAWDSYRNGNYDVYARTARIGQGDGQGSGKWGSEVSVASTAAYEAYPSIAYDPSGTLWVAYEQGGERWGKDYGADESSGFSVYQARAIRLIGYTREGRKVEPAADPGTALPGQARVMAESIGRQSDSNDWLVPFPDAWKQRGANRPTPPHPGPRNTAPRLISDGSGRLWLANRSPQPIFWTNVGTVWTEYVSSYGGGSWTNAVYLHHTDNLLDNRPALVSVNPGELLAINSSDGRRQYVAMAYMPGAVSATEKEVAADPYNNDLYMHRISLGPASGPLAVKDASAPPPAKADARDKLERDAVAAMRVHRIKAMAGNTTGNTSSKLQILRGEFHRHSEVSMDGGNDGTVLDQYRYMLDAAAMDWVGCCDHDNGAGREYTWWIQQKLTDIFYTKGKFVPMFSYERSVAYPEGHRNVLFVQRGVRVLPRLPRTAEDPVVRAPDTLMLYAYLKKFDGVVASHTSGTNMGTDWRDNDPDSEPIVEIYQGERQNYEMPGAPRTNSATDSIGGWRPKGFINLALEKGYKLAFEASSDHISTHMSYSNILATGASREALLDALKKRHVYGATDDILAEYSCGAHIMGDAFSSSTPPSLRVKLRGTAPFAKVSVIKNNNYVYTTQSDQPTMEFTWRDVNPDKGKTSYYYVRGEQTDGQIVWVSPMWITYTGT